MNLLDKMIVSLLEVTPVKKVFVNFHASTRNLDLVESFLGKNDKVLDVGCGLGLTGEHFSKNGFDVTGVELDSGLVKKTKKYASYEVHNESATKLPYKDNSFDSVIFMYVMHHIPVEKHLAVLNETQRVLKPNGKMILIEPDVNSKFDLYWDKLFFGDSFFHYFNVHGDFTMIKRGKMRIMQIPKNNISALDFSYQGDVE